MKALRNVGAAIGRIVDAFSYGGILLTAALTTLIGVLVIVDVVARQAGFSLLFISNVVLLATLWLAYAGVAHTHRVDGHVGVDTIVQMLPRRVRIVMAIFGELVCIAVTGVVIWSAGQQLALSYTYKVVMLGSFRMPVWYAQAAVPLGMLLLLLQSIRKLARHLRGRSPPTADS